MDRLVATVGAARLSAQEPSPRTLPDARGLRVQVDLDFGNHRAFFAVDVQVTDTKMHLRSFKVSDFFCAIVCAIVCSYLGRGAPRTPQK